MVGSVNRPRPAPVQLAKATPKPRVGEAEDPRQSGAIRSGIIDNILNNYLKEHFVPRNGAINREYDFEAISNRLNCIKDPRVLEEILNGVVDLYFRKKDAGGRITREDVEKTIDRVIFKFRARAAQGVAGASGTSPAGTQGVSYETVMAHIFAKADKLRKGATPNQKTKIEEMALTIGVNITAMNGNQLGQFFVWVIEIGKSEKDPTIALERIQKYSQAWHDYILSLRPGSGPALQRPYGGDF